jgi:riboflavin synthase
MFSGIIEEVGTVRSIEECPGSRKMTIACKKVIKGVAVGDSISVNGVCLTVTNINDNQFDVDIVAETLEKSNLNSIAEESKINLERAMRYNQRVSGHLVQGHVDTQAKVLDINKTEEWTQIEFEVDSDYKKYCIYKGSIAIDGVSLTISKVTSRGIQVALIPHTLSNTILSNYKIDQHVNIETDMVGKFIENFAGAVSQ